MKSLEIAWPAASGYAHRDTREAMEKVIKKDLQEKLKDKFSPEDINTGYDIRMKAMMRRQYPGKILPHGWPRFYWISARLAVKWAYCRVLMESALFNRGETQVMTIVTLGSMAQRQQLDGLGIEDTKHYIHHYNFPPFSTGETGRIGNTGPA